MELPTGYENRIRGYCQQLESVPVRVLGIGTQGTVLIAKSPRYLDAFAVKFHLRRVAYEREIGVYLRL